MQGKIDNNDHKLVKPQQWLGSSHFYRNSEIFEELYKLLFAFSYHL